MITSASFSACMQACYIQLCTDDDGAAVRFMLGDLASHVGLPIMACEAS